MTLREGSYNEAIRLANGLSKGTYEPISIPYVVTRRYIPDFVILDSGLIIEGKGRFWKDDKSKLLKIQAMGIDVKVLLQRANVRVPRTKHTHEQWLEQHHFTHAVGTLIPPHWHTCPKNDTNLEVLETLGILKPKAC